MADGSPLTVKPSRTYKNATIITVHKRPATEVKVIDLGKDGKVFIKDVSIT